MADQDQSLDTEKKQRLPNWLWTIIWSLLGILFAICIIGMILSPFAYLFNWANALGFTASGGGTVTAAQQTGTAQADGSGNGSLSTADQTATAQAGGSGSGSLSSTDQTATAQAGGSGAGGGSSADQTATAQAGGSGSGSGSSADQTATAQVGGAGTGGGSSADQTATAQAGGSGSGSGSSADQTATAQAGGSGSGSGSSADQTATAQAGGSGSGSGSSADQTATAQAGGAAAGGGSSADQTATAQAGGSGSGSGSSADQTATAQAGGAAAGTPTPTPTPSSTPTPILPQVEADTTIDLHAGPAREYPIIGSLPPNTPLRIIGTNDDESWWRIERPNGTAGWVDASLVETRNLIENIPVVQAPPLPPTPIAEIEFVGQGQDYIVQVDDWLSKLSEKFYGNAIAYWPIMAGTNRANAADSTYAKITNPDFIEVADKLRIPVREEAEAFMADFDPAAGEVDKLFGRGPQGQLLVGNWWTSGGEFSGIRAVYSLYRQENPGVELIHAGLAGGAGVNFKGTNLNKLIAGDPFDTFQLHAGLEAELYSPEEFLVPVDDILVETGALEVMPDDLVDLLKIRDNTYTVPLNIHRGNVMWTNTRLLEQAGVDVPTTWPEFFTACDTLQGQGIVPLGLGIADGFELSHTFEVVIAGTLGADRYRGLWNGATSWDDPEITTALQNFSRVLDCSNEDRSTINWVGGIDLVINDQAAFNIMGDWAYGEVIVKGALDHVTWNIAPGNQGQFFLISDGFALAQAAPNPANARNFLALLTRKDAQEAFNQNKGSICARTDCDYSVFPEDRRAYFQNAADDFANSTIIPMVTHGSGAIPTWQEQFGQIATQFASDRDVAAAQTALVLAAEDAGFAQ